MVSRDRFDTIISKLKQSRTNLRCEDLKATLRELGFEVRDGKNAGHVVYVHTGISEFRSGSFSCGHGRDRQVKPLYVRRVTQVLIQHEADLVE